MNEAEARAVLLVRGIERESARSGGLICLAATVRSSISTLVFGSSIRILQRQGWQQMDIFAGQAVHRSPEWACTIVGGVLERKSNGLFKGQVG